MDPNLPFDPDDPEALNDETIKENLNDLLSTKYRPATNEGDAHSMLSSEQLYDMVQKHAPLSIPQDRFHKAMQDLGYHDRCIEGRYFWLLKEV